eukprot:TRINITY_DN8596_c1_g2_i1.p1 TRINITY_DN8596_c1_g2~~TRINITY_DN8596_c1_g2_i1.p1  ORF type:complete len:388 (+),score=25.18 TRINITY_DN8596_c1_g2_i1:85-1248(+)
MVVKSIVVVTLLLEAASIQSGSLRSLAQANTQDKCDASNYDERPSRECREVFEMTTQASQLIDTNRYPYLISIQEDRIGAEDCYYHLCGGALISSDLVLTAAHCVITSGVDPKNEQGSEIQNTLYASFAPYCRHQNGDTQDRVLFDRVWVNPSYDENNPDSVGDVAILRLAQPVSVPFVKVSGTPSIKQDDQFLVGGWGFYTQDDFFSFRYLKQPGRTAILEPISLDTCRKRLLEEGEIEGEPQADMICLQNPGAEICGGDSGSPLISLGNSYQEDVIVGVASWGPDITCQGQSQYGIGVFINIGDYIDFVRGVMGQTSNQSNNSQGGQFQDSLPAESPTDLQPTSTEEPSDSITSGLGQGETQTTTWLLVEGLYGPYYYEIRQYGG